MTLTIQDLGALGELLGSVAVLATLVYLAMQTRQNTMAIAAQVDAARTSASIHIGLTQATSTELQEAMAEDRVDEITINEERLRDFWRAVLINFQWQRVQAGRGLLPTYHESSISRAVLYFFSTYRSFEGFWEEYKSFMLPEFVEFVDEQRSKPA